MVDILRAFSATNTLTMTLASLASAAARGCTAVDNTTTKYLDALVQIKILRGATTLASAYCSIYVVGSLDGTTWSDGYAGTDAAVTQVVPPNSNLGAVINCPTTAVAYTSQVFSVANSLSPIFGGILPPYWGIVLVNGSGTALNGTEGNHTKQWRGVFLTG